MSSLSVNRDSYEKWFFWSTGYCFNVHLSICNLYVRPRESTGRPLCCCLYDTQLLPSSRLRLPPLVSHFHRRLSPICGLFFSKLLFVKSNQLMPWCSLEFRLFFFFYVELHCELKWKIQSWLLRFSSPRAQPRRCPVQCCYSFHRNNNKSGAVRFLAEIGTRYQS